MGKLAVLLLLASVNGLMCQSLFSLPFNVINGIAGATLGVVRGGINIIDSTVSNIRNGARSVTDSIKVLLEELRRYMLTGIPELGLPILDPLSIERIDLNISHEALALEGYLEDIRVRYLSRFRLDHINYRMAQKVLELNVTFPLLDIKGFYDIKGDVGQLFTIFGKGRFWIKLYDFSLETISKLRFGETIYPPFYVESLKLTPKLKKLENYFEGLMNNEELGETFNKAITKLAPTALETLWPEIEPDVTRVVLTIINEKLQDLRFINIVGRILDVFKLNLNQGRLNIHN